MENYFNNLMSSSLPLPLWVLIIIWFILFIAAHILTWKGNALANQQSFIVTRKTDELVSGQNWRLTVFQILFTSAIFTFATIIGGPFFVFFAGGWIVITAVSIPLNLRSVLYLRAIVQSEAATGSVTISNRLAVKDVAFKLYGLAAFCLILGLVMAHLALLGGALFISATATGYLRKLKQKK